MRHLPVHPTKRHPHTGAPLRAIFVRKDGRVFWPILGASPDDQAEKAAADAAAAKAATDKAAEDAAATKAAADKAAADKAAGEKGFPDNTPVAEMKPEEQAAYHRFQSRKHEDRAKGWADAFPGKTAAEIKAIVDAAEAARRNTLTLDEKTLEDERAKVRKETLAELGPKAVASAFNLLLPSDMPDKEKAEILEDLNLSKFLNDDNEVNTAKVKAHVDRIAGPAKGPGSARDFGQGRRGNSAPAGSVAAVKEARRQAREDKIKTS